MSFVLTATDIGNPTHLDLTLLNGNGNAVAGTGPTDKSVSYIPKTAGTYYLAVSSYQGDSIGTYRLDSVTTGSGGGAGNTGSGSVPVYRFFDTVYGTHFFTSSSGERATVVATRPDLKDEGVGLLGTSSSDPNAAPVYRFFDTVFGTQFLTSNSGERDTILASRPDLLYQGIGFYDYAQNQGGSTGVYRFFDTVHGTHFFTGSASEAATIGATRSDLVNEGIAFYAPAS